MLTYLPAPALPPPCPFPRSTLLLNPVSLPQPTTPLGGPFPQAIGVAGAPLPVALLARLWPCKQNLPQGQTLPLTAGFRGWARV